MCKTTSQQSPLHRHLTKNQTLLVDSSFHKRNVLEVNIRPNGSQFVTLYPLRVPTEMQLGGKCQPITVRSGHRDLPKVLVKVGEKHVRIRFVGMGCYHHYTNNGRKDRFRHS